MGFNASVAGRTQLMVLALVVAACASDKNGLGAGTDGGDGSGGSEGGSESESDTGPEVSGSALSGEYRIESITVSCAGDCSAPGGLLGPVSYCDIGDQDTDYTRVEHAGATLQIDFDQGRAQGTIEADGSFSLTGEATEGGGAVALSATVVGNFTGRHEGFTAIAKYTADGLHDGDPINCAGEIEMEAVWERDDCNNDENACPAEFPICFQDACNAGVEGDECWDVEDCADGMVCFDDACAPAGAVGDGCDREEHCAEGLLCVAERCSAGEVGDACEHDDDCDSEICYEELCQAGDVGDPCDWDDECKSNLECLEDNTCGTPD